MHDLPTRIRSQQDDRKYALALHLGLGEGPVPEHDGRVCAQASNLVQTKLKVPHRGAVAAVALLVLVKATW